MADLITTSQLAEPDALYNALVDAHRGLDDEQSAELNAKLVLLLANHIGEPNVLAQAIALAKRAD
ncbi:DUF2783 domain-containing protein [Breoghania sp. L-A4]|uniref:DUF2783 domain-containing protein n=1 Tax=Breoghania sp. L-A4 TaxID=2304600 RepID=UPI000E35D2A7|nr:DUF2783 domain-containing protein [Breoghania sp. L-A4]AXS40323.1 DUF2783 domain-containing protein [Breoghania sp. L-A4]